MMKTPVQPIKRRSRKAVAVPKAKYARRSAGAATNARRTSLIPVRRKIESQKDFEDFFQPVPPDQNAYFQPTLPKEDEKKRQVQFLAALRDFQVNPLHRIICLFDNVNVCVLLQWSHGMPEKTLADMLEMMRKGDVCEYIRSGSRLPHKHTAGDRHLRDEVGIYRLCRLSLACACCRCALY